MSESNAATKQFVCPRGHRHYEGSAFCTVCGAGPVLEDLPAATTEGENAVSDMSDYATWKDSARNSAEAAIDIYTDREADVERELALHLARALRELDKRDGSADEATLEGALGGLVADGLLEERASHHA